MQMKKISYRYLLENTLSPSKMKSKNSMKNISYTTIYKFQHELDKSDLLPGFPCCSQSCKEKAEQKDSFASDIYLRPPCIWRNGAASPRASPGSPSRVPCLPRTASPALCSQSSVGRSASSLHEATEFWNHLQMRWNTNMKCPLPPSNELHISSKQPWQFTGRICSGYSKLIPHGCIVPNINLQIGY